MADRNLELALRMRADLQQARRQIGAVERELGGMTQGGDRAQRSMRKLGREADRTQRRIKGVSDAAGTLRNALAAVGAGLVLRAFVRATDTYTNLESQIRLVTDSQAELNEVQRETYELANETRQRLGATVNLYARLARATEELNLSNDQLLTLTRAINQSFIVSGASATEAEASILQLSQGIASGTLRGEELNSVLENSPRLARALAEGLGVTIGELRKLGEEGRLTGETVTRALLSTADGIERDFQDMQRTVGQALTQLRNDLIQTFGPSETQGFVDAIDELRDIITDPQFAQSMVTLGTAVADLAGYLGQATTNGVEFTKWLSEEAASRLHGVAADDLPRLNARVQEIRKMLDTPSRSLVGQGQRLRLFGPTGLIEYWDDEELQSELGRLQGQIADYWARVGGGPGTDTPGAPPSPAGDDDDDGSNKPIIPGGGSGTSEAQKAMERALSTLTNLDSGLQQQIATFGEGEAAVLKYRLTVGDLADDVARLGVEGETLAASIVRQAEEVQALAEAEERRAEAERERQQAQQQAEEDLQRILDQADPARSLERQLALIERLKAEFPEYAAALEHAAEQVRGRIAEMNQGLISAQAINAEFAYGAADALGNFASDIAQGKDAIDSLGDTFAQFAADFLRQIAQMIIQQAIFNALQNSSGGGIGGAIAGALQFHGGGVVGQGGTPRDLFGTAPRYHTGGIAGLAPDEVPAILRKGEEVLTSNDPRHRDNQRGASGEPPVVHNYNMFDAGEMTSAGLATPAGEAAIYNHVSRNRSKYQALFGSNRR
ncbi:tape measure protein [Halomonas stenophila]|uniref:Tape measure domain-containing protein n=1 Tax=Halomonas stenophila TaxID=795312 RepID=A0A7W5HLM7_9GAMM|nr:tape measure protein [Halomonas stenophila]MBB3231702.1 tape measure domain-containing protein [Halomonas stenophila]